MDHSAHSDHSAHHAGHAGEHHSWLDTWWPALVIAFGVICVLALDFWHPASSV